ncbi:hypothetical protein J4476_05255 [Candidatus Woesearchaeota archaeon]|nr:hypothetical protein [Candidatus Woesearchaeota archaeon]HIH26026.1 hypothetical protein [Nanoarchaeota archaeon]
MQSVIEINKPLEDGKVFLDKIIKNIRVRPVTSLVMLGGFPNVQYNYTYFVDGVNIVLDSYFIINEDKKPRGFYMTVVLYSENSDIESLVSKINSCK